ncbi:MAG: 23S rRNA (uracil(1939)-C(5))-methyltransferase RlmD, partial [Calditrichaeota bacterium]
MSSSAPNSRTVKRGEELTLRIDSLAFGGRGVARVDGLVVFVDDSLPGQLVRARVVRKCKGFAEARMLQVLEESPEAVAPRCAHFGECGGCRLQNLDYQAQLRYKQQQVVESLQHIGGLASVEVRTALPSPDLFHYRNKMEYSFGRQRWLTRAEVEADRITKPRDFALGLHVRGRFDRILDIDECHLQSPLSVDILKFVRDFAGRSGIRPYSTNDHTGFWRHLVVREGKHTGQVMVNLVTAALPESYPAVETLVERLAQRFPEITTAVHNINRKKAQVATGDEERVLLGPGTIQERLGERLFEISANSFFQTNTRGAERLFRCVSQLADFGGSELVYDLYCGAGSISLTIADRVRAVVGFEVVEEAVADARRNCELNRVHNCEFVSGDVRRALGEAVTAGKWGLPDVVLVDP